jgi:predicted ATPase
MNRAATGLIRTPDQRLRVFVSSTLRELASERRAARSVIERLALAPVMFELGARPHPPRSLYRAYLEQSDVFIGIYWESYGWVAPGEEVSGLEDEYNLAPGVPMLIYIKESEQRDAQLNELLDRIRDDDRVSYVAFKTAAELKRLLTSDLATLLAERFASASIYSGPSPEPVRAAGATTLITPPRALTRLVGREDETAALVGMLSDDACRLVTITGPGGVGKTRLAIAVAAELEPHFPDGVAFVDLSPVDDPALVLDAVASAVGIRVAGESRLIEQLRMALRGRRLLLVLDNAEQVAEAAPQLADLVTSTASSLLVTSRSLLRIDGERSFPLEPVPSDSATELFTERARSVRPDFALTESNSKDVSEICEAVDRLPLAIELAAARVRHLSPAEIAQRLERTLSFLVEGPRDRPERQRALRSTIEWSARLLQPEERSLLLRLGVFRSGFSLDAVEWINDEAADGDALQLIGSLVDASLVQEHDRGTRTWFAMMATVREYARECLATTGELARSEDRHATFYVRLAATAGANLIGPNQETWLSRLVDEAHELTAAVEFLLDNQRWDEAVDLVWSLDWFWGVAGRLVEVARWMQRVVDDGQEASDRSRNIALLEVIFIGVWRRPDASTIPQLLECIDFCRAEEDRLTEIKALIGIAWLQLQSSPPDAEAAEENLQRAVLLAEALDDPFSAAMVGLTRGLAHLVRGNIEQATASLDACMGVSRRIGDRLLLGALHNARGWAAVFAGDVERAEECFREQLLIASTIGHEPGVAYALEGCFATAISAGDVERGGTLMGAAEAIRQRKGNADAAAMSMHAPLVQKLEQGPTSDAFEKARIAGRNLDPNAAVELALSSPANDRR